MPIATAKRSFEDIPQISKPYFISGNFWSAGSDPRILTLYKMEDRNYGYRRNIWRRKNSPSYKGALWEMVKIATP